MLEGTFATAITVALDVTTGQGMSAGAINPAATLTDNDYFKFTTTAADFVTVLADTANETPVSALNARITVYGSADLTDIVAAGASNGQLTSGLARDGWAGFVSQANRTYFVVVSSEGVDGGTYTLRVGATTTGFTVGNEPDPAPPAPTGIGRELNAPPPMVPFPPIAAIQGILARRQQDIVYKYVAPDRDFFDSLVTVNTQSTISNLANRLDTRLDVYDATGKPVTAANDSDSGRINDAYTAFKAKPGDVFYVRVRSDEIGNANVNLATGVFFLVFDSVAANLPINPVTRIGGDPGGAFVGFGPALTNPAPGVPSPTFQTASYSFVAGGNGLTIITAQPTGLAPVTDPAMRLYDATGTLIYFNDNFAGASPQFEVQLQGGDRYYIVVDGFEINSRVQFTLDVETNHTFDPNPDTAIDDHPNNPIFAGGPVTADVRRQFEAATALKFGAASLTFDGNRNPLRDRGYRSTATGTGRIHQSGSDTDLFQFTAPVDMLNEYAGNNDDLGTSLFIGGNFNFADPNSAYPVGSRNLVSWDASDYWYAGAQFFDPQFNVTYGFNDNPDSAFVTGAQVYVMYEWDPFPNTDPTNGTTDHILMVGGDFDLIVPTAFGPVTLRNMAGWAQNQNTGAWRWTNPLGSANGAVRAFQTYDPEAYDPDGSGPAPTLPDPSGEVLIAGGEFTDIGGGVDMGVYLPGTAVNFLAKVDATVGAWVDVGGGALDAGVFALTTYDFVDPGSGRPAQPPPAMPPLDEVIDPYDPPLSLIVGGEFTGGITTWEGNAITPMAFFSPSRPPVPATVQGQVYALQTFDDPDPDGPGPLEAANVLVIGGLFDSAGNVANCGNLVKFGRMNDPMPDLTLPTYNPHLIWETMTAGGGGTEAVGFSSGAVLTMTVWDPPDINRTPIAPILVFGGDFQSIIGFPIGNIAGYGNTNPASLAPGGYLNLWGNGANGIVRTLATVRGGDEQEPSIEAHLVTGNLQDPLYLGGDFTTVQLDPMNPPIVVNGVAQFSAFLGTPFPDFFEFSSLANGVSSTVDATDPMAAPAQVFSLAVFDDGNPFQWDHHDRRNTRLSITLAPDSGSFLNTWVRVYDSNFNIVYGFDRPGSNTINPPFPDPAGMIDGSLAAPQFNTQLEGIQLWGGETYYIEVSAGPGQNGNPGNGLGRYSFNVVLDALPPDVPIPPATTGNGILDDINALMLAEPLDSAFAQAIKINTALGSGDGLNLVNASTQPIHGNTIRAQHVQPSAEAAFTMAGDLGNISSLSDTDLYYFRAEFTGTAEIRVTTTGIPDEYGEQLGNAFRGDTKVISSNLDSALRIYDNDFVQMAYADDASGISGEFQNDNVGTLGATFRRRDARMVIHVEAGKQYFIQVESGQRYKNGAPADPLNRVLNVEREIDWRFSTGGYALLVNAMPQNQQDIENGVSVTDDHTNFLLGAPNNPMGLATIIPMSNAGTGSLTGVINNTLQNRTDQDLFRFTNPGFGALRVRMTPTGVGTANPTLIPAMQLYRYNTNTAALVFVADGQPIGNGVLEVVTSGLTGEAYVILATGLNDSEGAYRVDVSGVAFIDDYGDFSKWSTAAPVVLYDFLGKGEINGSIEIIGDTDVFRFSTNIFANFTAQVTALDSSLAPSLTVYEVSEDRANNPIYLRIGNHANPNSIANPSVIFSVSPDRIVDVPDPGVDREYPYYYVVVKGRDPFADRGAYKLTITFPPSDDHADADTNADAIFDTGEYSFATNIALDAITGRGNTTGIIEINADSDLFSFTAPTSGEARVTISRPVGSLMRARVSILDSNANIILDVSGFPSQTVGEDSLQFFQAIVDFNAVRGTTYFIAVEGFNDPLFPNVATTDTGDYTVSVNSPPVDDYPNVNEFVLSDTQAIITLSASTGMGQLGGDAAGDPANPRINPSNDTDLFTFTTRAAGLQTITVTPFDSIAPAGRLAARVSLFIANGSGGGTLVQTVAATAALQAVTITIPAALAGVKYYVLVEARTGIPGATSTGEYRIKVAGPMTGTGPDPGQIDFNSPIVLPLDSRTGDGCDDDTIEISGDRDLYRFRSIAAGKIFVQVTTAEGSLLDASISVYNQANELIASRVVFDADGYAGVTASASFVGVANTDYYVIVDGLGDSTGSYQVCINAQPAVNRLYFPEGFASDETREFISIINPNSVTTNYTVYLRYETTDAQTIIANGSVGPNARGGLTIIDGKNFAAPGIIKGTPYSVIIESDQPLGATLAHYDFGRSIGDSFTERLSTSWNFARVERDNGNVLDFIVFFNPNNFKVDVTLTAYQTDTAVASLTKTFDPNRRGGFALNNIPNFPRGIFSSVLTVVATSPADQPALQGVAASLSHYDMARGAAFGLLGDPDGGTTAGAVTNFIKGSFSTSEVVFFNPNDVPVTVSLTGSYLRTILPQFTRTFDIKAKGQVVLTDTDFGLIADSPVGLTYTSSLPVTVNSANYQFGDADSSTASTVAGTNFLFGDAFIDPSLAGNKFFEFLYLYNPAAANSTVTIKLHFTDGTSGSFNVLVNGRGFAEVKLHERGELLSRTGPTWFSVNASSATPFTMTMTHYDLLLGGGWATTGVPLGFVNAVARIP